ncbi:hypothetical protein niasHT_030624 [Heterodera trifolii]|uniref:Heat shock protein 75 kDa, mitochondrial n=1 Tax=Heterodera trifolii TaxID=157864 RepID=A0ABD2HWZ8_9BILA
MRFAIAPSLCRHVLCRHCWPRVRFGRLLSSSASFQSVTATTSSTNSFSACRYSSQAAAVAPENYEFQAEINSLLGIVAKSLYSDQEVFIRELISNASDALEKRRCSELQGDAAEEMATLELRIEVDEKGKKLTFVDTGIGMSRDELVNLLGTIAKSGSKAFRADEKNAAAAEAIIGQFGVGFYSAFVVSEKVSVTTRKLGEEMGHIWSWNGGTHFTVEEKADADIGTKVELHLKAGEAEKFAVPQKVVDVINKYSYFVTAPIFVNGERINVTRALWTMAPSETTPEMHETFFKQLAKTHHPHLADDRPQYTIQYQTDSPINIRALFYVPTKRVSHLEFAADSQRDIAISLYNQRVLIKPNAKELVPHYLRFLIGVVDSEDVPLNLSREMLQTDLILEKIRKTLTERCVRFFLSQLSKDRVKYNDFYMGYSMFFKEGVVTEQSNNTKEEIAQLLLFESSSFRPGTLTTLSEYVERMQSEQKNIYYIYAPSRQLAETSPYFELFKDKYEVLFLSDPADELVFLSMPQFHMKSLQSLEKWTKEEGLSIDSDKESSAELMRDSSKKEFLGWLRDSLGTVRVSDIKPSGRQSEHPFMITISADMGAARHMLRITEIKEMEHLVMLRPVLHVNLSHPVVAGLMRLKRQNAELATEIAIQVYENALCTAGLLKDTSKMVGRLNKIFAELLQLNAEKSQILTP